MAEIPGSVRVTGIIAPTDDTDTYAVTDTQYGLDGLRNFSGATEALSGITAQRRRSGMIAGIVSGGTRLYYRLNDAPWSYNMNDWTQLTLYDYTGQTSFTDIAFTEQQYWTSGNTSNTSIRPILNDNLVSGNYSFAIGSGNTVANGSGTTILGGFNNYAGQFLGIVVNGLANSATTIASSVINGIFNRATATQAFVGAGFLNWANNTYASIINGSGNTASGTSATVLNGSTNVAGGDYSTILNGSNGKAIGNYSSILAGIGNIASGFSQSVVGQYNVAQGTQAIFGMNNYAFIIGGGTSLISRANALAVSFSGLVQMRGFSGDSFPTTNVYDGAIAYSANTGLYQYVNGVWTRFTSGAGAGGTQTWEETLQQSATATTTPVLSGAPLTFRYSGGSSDWRFYPDSNATFLFTGTSLGGWQFDGKYVNVINSAGASTKIGNDVGNVGRIISYNGTSIGEIRITSLLTTDRNWTFPDQSGTIALMTDLTGNTGGAPQTLACLNPTTTWDLDLGHNAAITLSANTTFSITNVTAGDYGTVVVTQDATGGHTITPPGSSIVVNGAGGLLNLTSNANAIDLLTFYYDGSRYYWNLGGDYT